jgi:hypothetical protein
VVNAILLVLLAYAGVGLLIAIAFVTRGVGVVDHAARGAPWPFRLLILPGAAALWPLILVRWTAAARGARR